MCDVTIWSPEIVGKVDETMVEKKSDKKLVLISYYKLPKGIYYRI